MISDIQEQNKRNTGWIFILMTAVIFSFGGMLVKEIRWNAISVLPARGLMGVCLFCCWTDPFKIKLNRIKIISALCFFAQGALLVLAFKYTTAGNATILQNISPIFIMILDFLVLKRKPTAVEVIVCAVLFAGVVTCIGGSASTAGGIKGDLLALLSGLFYAGVFFCNAMPDANAKESLLIGNALHLLFIPFCFTDMQVRSSGIGQWLLVGLYAFAISSLAWLCFSYGIKSTPPLQAGFLGMAEPALSPVWAYLFLREKMSRMSFIGFMIVAATLIFYNIWAQRKGGGKKIPAVDKDGRSL